MLSGSWQPETKRMLSSMVGADLAGRHAAGGTDHGCRGPGSVVKEGENGHVGGVAVGAV